jgi:peptide/nickel transport system permease protein
VLRFLAVRTGHAAAIVLFVVTVTFALVRLAPGDPFSAAGESTLVPRAAVAAEMRRHGLDRPIAEQYLRYLGQVARGNFGYSYSERRPVLEAFRDRVPNTLLLATTGLAITFALGIAVGAWQGARAGPRADAAVSFGTLTVYSTPAFWLGLMLLLVFGEQLRWLPAGGTVDPVLHAHLTWLGRAVDRARHLALPALTLGMLGAATVARFQRAQVREVRHADYVRTARAKGLTERAVLWRHTLRTALLPAVTLFGLLFPVLLSGAVLVETVFSWPGLGRFAVQAIYRRDYPVVTAAAVVAGVMVALGNLLADVLHRAVDPRTR